MVLGTYYYAIPVVNVDEGKNGQPHRLARTQLEGPNVGDTYADTDTKAEYMTVKYAGCSDLGVVDGKGHIYYRGVKAMATNGEKDSQWECITVEDGAGNVVIAEADYTQATGGSSVTEGLSYMDFMVTSAKGKFATATAVRVEYDNESQGASWNKLTNAANAALVDVKKMRRVTLIDETKRYTFTRNGETSVSYGGQTLRLEMVGELASYMSKGEIANVTAGGALAKFQEVRSGKQLENKTAASVKPFLAQVFADHEATSTAMKDEPAQVATRDGKAGYLSYLDDGETKQRLFDKRGYESNQLFMKTMIGGLVSNQIVNGYLGDAKMDGTDNQIRTDNDNGILESGKNYTEMEHNFDEAFGYLWGLATNAQTMTDGVSVNPDDILLDKYLQKVNKTAGYKGIAQDILDAFRVGRQAIVEKDYETRDAQRLILKRLVSKVVLVRAHYYLDSALGKDVSDDSDDSDKAAFFHDLSEGMGFLLSTMETDDGNGLPLVTETELKDSGLFELVSVTIAGPVITDIDGKLLRPVSAWKFLVDGSDDRKKLIALRDLLAGKIAKL